MLKQKNSKQYLLAAVALSFFALALTFHKKSIRPTVKVSKQESALNINRDFLKFFSIGNKRILASTLWIQTLLESDNEKYKGKDMNSWMYHRFRTIAELDPWFYENYLFGGMFLSIIKDDLEGAADIYERGLARYPMDFRLNYNAGFNYYFEMGQFEEGLKLLEKIEDHPDAPSALKFIINKLRFEAGGNYDVALAFLLHNLENTKDPVLINKLSSDYYALKAERDLVCLNEGQRSCDRRDAEGAPYVLVNGVWKTQRPYKPYKIHLPKK